MERRVLSIQSHVVHGYVGNKSAVFPLQLLGFDVDFVNSVQFSNHTGYSGGFKGQVLNGEQLEVLVAGLAANDLLARTSHLLTGYIGSVTFLRAVAATHAQLKESNPNLVYVCDPVLGDNGKLYVPPELVGVYRSELIPLATVLTPNQFEAEQLTGGWLAIKSLEDALTACVWLHDKGPDTVIITSLELEDDQNDGGDGGSNGGDGGSHGEGVKGGGFITMLASKRRQKPPADHSGQLEQKGEALAGVKDKEEEDGFEAWVLRIPKLEGSYTGTGDLTAALFLAHLSSGLDSSSDSSSSSSSTDSFPQSPTEAALLPPTLPGAMSAVAASLASVIQRTLETAGPGAELRLVQSKRDLEAPDTTRFVPSRVHTGVVARAQKRCAEHFQAASTATSSSSSSFAAASKADAAVAAALEEASS